MLVLSRSTGEAINIGPDIVITVISIGNGRVKLGINAPRDVPVCRDELGPPRVDGGLTGLELDSSGHL
jgi:carbon storage regulator